MNSQLLSKAEAAAELLKRRRARNSLIDFIQYTLPQYPNPAHQIKLARSLEAVERGEIKNLMVIMPPRHLKSETCSIRFPAWYFGRNPQKAIIGCSYSDNKAYTFSYAVRELINSPKYQKLWPLQFQTSGAMHWQLAGKHDLRPSYIAAGVGGGITGEGASVLIIDDPLKNAAEAASDTIRESIWQWYITTAITRLEPDGAKIVIMTRWHDDDLAGRLLKVAQKDPKADQWTVLHLKAINEKGEALWPEKFPLEYLEKVRAGQIDDPEQPGKGSRAFAALYQGEPSIAEGNILHRSWWKFYRQAPAKFDRVIQSWDCTFKDTLGTDFVVGQVWGQLGADKYLLDQVRDRMDFPTTVSAILTLSAKWPQARAKLIEDKANGPAVIATLKRKVSGMIPIEPEEIGNKVARAWGVSPDIEAGNVWLPDGLPWVHDFVEECASFPNGAFDDQVDAMSQALNYLSEEAPKDQVVVYDSMQLVRGIDL